MCPAGPKASYPRPLGAGVVGVRSVEIILGGRGGSRIDDSRGSTGQLRRVRG